MSPDEREPADDPTDIADDGMAPLIPHTGADEVDGGADADAPSG